MKIKDLYQALENYKWALENYDKLKRTKAAEGYEEEHTELLARTKRIIEECGDIKI